MIVLAGRVTTPVPHRPYIFTGVPVSRVATVLPGVPHVRARLPEAPVVRAGLPSVPHFKTRRPPTKNRLVAGNTMSVSGSAVVHARLGVEFAEQSVQVDQAGKIAVGLGAVSAVGVSGTAVVRALYRVDAANAVEATGSGVARARHTLTATQAIATTTGGGDARALYRLTAVQNIVVDQPVDTRPFIDVAASQDVGVVSAASSVPSVGTVNADATQDIGVDSAAVVRVRHAVTATQSIVSGQSTILDGLRVPLAASQGVVVSGSGDARALYTLPAAQSIATSSAGVASPSLSATGTAGVDGTGLSRARHTLTASSTATVDSIATATAAYFAYDNASTAEGLSTTSLNIAVSANATVIVFVAGNVTQAARIDGVSMTLVGQTTNAAMYFATGVAAGTRTIQTDRSGSSGHIVSAVSYTGVSAVSGGTFGSGTGTTPTGTPTGSGGRVVVGFDFGSGTTDAFNAVTSNGDIRVKYRRNTGNCLAVVDRATAPVELYTSESRSWTSIAVRLT